MAKTEKQILAEIDKSIAADEKLVDLYNDFMTSNPSNSSGYALLIGSAIGRQQSLASLRDFITGDK